MMTKRSSHIPTFTNSEMTNRQTTLVRTFLIQSELGRDHVAEDQRPVDVPVRPDMRFLIMNGSYWLPLYQADEGLHHVAVGHDEAGGEHDLGHVLEVLAW